MLFHDPIFLILFLPIVFFSYFFLAKYFKTDRYIILILSGLIFYAYWNLKFFPLILGSIVVNYVLGRKILSIEDAKSKKKILFIAIFFNILYLGFFKYTDFAIYNLNILFNLKLDYFDLPFPLALSFVTFQTIAFLIDCYDKNIFQLNIKKYALFIIFFPQLIAGPIVRYNNMISQFDDQNNFKINLNNIIIGLLVIIIGLIKKLYIADYLSIIVDDGFNSKESLSFLISWITSLSFTFQLYFDFSGYVDMATGIALLFNINLPTNFNSPFKSTSIINFWQRWHITLTNFLTNCIYNPWAKSLRELTFSKSMLITLTVFIIAGIWHGPTWFYVVFGLMHGAGLVVNHCFRKLTQVKLNRFLCQLITFNYINISFIFFRSDNFYSVKNILQGMLGLSGFKNIDLIYYDYKIFIVLIFAIIICFFFKNTHNIMERVKKISILN